MNVSDELGSLRSFCLRIKASYICNLISHNVTLHHLIATVFLIFAALCCTMQLAISHNCFLVSHFCNFISYSVTHVMILLHNCGFVSHIVDCILQNVTTLHNCNFFIFVNLHATITFVALFHAVVTLYLLIMTLHGTI